MHFESSDLYQATKEYVQAAMRLLAGVCPEGPSDVLVGLDEWKRDSDGIFRLHDREDPFWVRCIRANEERLHSLDEYHRLVAILRSIPVVAQQMENLVGTALESMRIEVDHLTDRLVWRLPRILGGLHFSESHFDHLFEEFHADLQRTSLSFIVLAPLVGLKLESAPIRLGPDSEIDSMSDNEIARCLTLGLLPQGIPFSLRRMAEVRSAAAVRVRYDLKKWIGRDDSRQADVEAALKVELEAMERAMAVLHALRVFKDGRVSVPGLLQFSPHWPAEGATRFQYSNPGRMPWFNKYDLTRSEIDEFYAFWTTFQQVTAKGALANAVRRFSYASDRDRDDDRLVDLMIAAESLFLADVGPPQERGELRYRLALRAAFFIDSPEYSTRETFKHMRRAYDVRSAIVHGGGEPDADLLKSPMDAPLSLQDFTKVTEGLLRRGLKKGIDLVRATGSTHIDWDALIIPP